MTMMRKIELMKEPKREPIVTIVSLFPLCDATLTVKGWRPTKGLSGAGRPSAPAVEGKTGFIPKGYCVAWNKGGCSKDNFTYKHETPKPRDRSRKPSKTRGRSTDRSESPSQRGKARRCANFGSRVDVIGELIANSFLRFGW